MSRTTRTLVVFTLSIVIAALFSTLVYQAGQRTPAATVTTTQVAVATRALPVGSRLRASDLRLVEWPVQAQVEGAITSIEAAVDRGLVAAVVENEPITSAKLAAVGSVAGLPSMIAAGMRAISVKVDDVVGVAGFVVPGAHVDVVVSMAQRDDSVARVVVSNVEVLATGTRAEQGQTPEGRNAATSVVTLLVSPPDAERISLASSVGRITLTLRNPLDTGTSDTRGTPVTALLGAPDPPPPSPRPAAPRVVRAPAPAPAAPAPPPPAPYTVETIRAAKRTAEVVK